MRMDVNIYVGVIAVNSASIPRVKNPCCGKVPTTPHCPLCGKKATEELDLGMLEPINGYDSKILYFNYPGVTQEVHLDFIEEVEVADLTPSEVELPEQFRHLAGVTWNPRRMVARLSY